MLIATGARIIYVQARRAAVLLIRRYGGIMPSLFQHVALKPTDDRESVAALRRSHQYRAGVPLDSACRIGVVSIQ